MCDSKNENPEYIRYKNIHLFMMPFIDQNNYDSLLYCCDFNLVRGEDSLARAVLSGKPFIWNAYLQDNKYQRVKTEALLGKMEKYFQNREVFADYSNLLIRFNDVEYEDESLQTDESYTHFFKDLNKIEHATTKMSYFISLNCDLIDNFTNFLIRFET